MNLTILEIIKKLEKQGHDIEYTHRKDGGYIIRKIDGQHFSGNTGNAFARRMIGAKLSQARQVQLARIRLPKGKAPHKLTPLPKELKQQLRKVQRSWRKKHPDIEGTISTRGLRYQYEHYGLEKTKASLDKAFRYSEGYAYLDNVQHLIERINLDLNKEESAEMEEARDLIERKMFDFKEEWISPIYSALYEWEKGSISAQECARQIKAIIS